MACIDWQGIPGDLLNETASEDLDINAAGEALSKLIDFALITELAMSEGSLFVMHALVHAAIQAFVSASEKTQAAMSKTGEVLQRILPNGEHANWIVG